MQKVAIVAGGYSGEYDISMKTYFGFIFCFNLTT